MDFPDPSVMQAADGQYYAYATAGNGVNCQLATSSDSINWSLQGGYDCINASSITWGMPRPGHSLPTKTLTCYALISGR